MSLPPVTPWFPGSVNPARPGVYQVVIGLTIMRFAFWDGSNWRGFASPTPAQANQPTGPVWRLQPTCWRGLSADPALSASRWPWLVTGLLLIAAGLYSAADAARLLPWA